MQREGCRGADPRFAYKGQVRNAVVVEAQDILDKIGAQSKELRQDTSEKDAQLTHVFHVGRKECCDSATDDCFREPLTEED